MLARLDRPRGQKPMCIGIVNNMPASAKQASIAQFKGLLEAAAGDHALQIRVFTVFGAPLPAGAGQSALWDAGIDGLIVTGTEPLAAQMTALAKLVDWAGRQTVSAIWSCLAAQAAVLRLDGIIRQPLPDKLSGVYQCEKAADHDLVADAPASWPVPHSRYNGLDERELSDSGYLILSRARRVGPDLFIKPVADSLFVMLQGHPEYGAHALLREYRRDIKRFLLGQCTTYPGIPEGYFSGETARALAALREQIEQQARLELPAAFDAAAGQTMAAPWQQDGVRLYARWLSYIAEHRQSCAAYAAAVPENMPVS
jgi:homoserine O-succinyltransferase